MGLLECIASWEFDYMRSFGMPAIKNLITKQLEMDEKTYRKEIAKLKKEGLIRSTMVYDYDEDDGGLIIRGWELTEKARNLEIVKRIEKEIEERYPNLTLLDRNNIIEFIEKIQNDKFSANDLREMQETYAKIEWKNDRNIIHKLFRKY